MTLAILKVNALRLAVSLPACLLKKTVSGCVSTHTLPPFHEPPPFEMLYIKFLHNMCHRLSIDLG